MLSTTAAGTKRTAPNMKPIAKSLDLRHSREYLPLRKRTEFRSRSEQQHPEIGSRKSEKKTKTGLKQHNTDPTPLRRRQRKNGKEREHKMTSAKR